MFLLLLVSSTFNDLCLFCNSVPETFKVLETSLKEEWYRLLANVPLLEHENARQNEAAAKFFEEGTI